MFISIFSIKLILYSNLIELKKKIKISSSWLHPCETNMFLVLRIKERINNQLFFWEPYTEVEQSYR